MTFTFRVTRILLLLAGAVVVVGPVRGETFLGFQPL